MKHTAKPLGKRCVLGQKKKTKNETENKNPVRVMVANLEDVSFKSQRVWLKSWA